MEINVRAEDEDSLSSLGFHDDVFSTRDDELKHKHVLVDINRSDGSTINMCHEVSLVHSLCGKVGKQEVLKKLAEIRPLGVSGRPLTRVWDDFYCQVWNDVLCVSTSDPKYTDLGRSRAGLIEHSYTLWLNVCDKAW